MGVTVGWERAIQGVSVTATPRLLGKLLCSSREAPIHVLCRLRGREWERRGVSECWWESGVLEMTACDIAVLRVFFLCFQIVFIHVLRACLVLVYQWGDTDSRSFSHSIGLIPPSAIFSVTHRGHSYYITLHKYFVIGFECDEIDLWHIFSSLVIPNLINKPFFTKSNTSSI